MVTVSLVRGGANDHLVAHSEAVHVADFDIGRAGARIRRERRAVRLRADARDRDGLDPMADAVDVQPDLVTGRDVGDGRHLDVGRAGGRVRRQEGLRARLADRGDRGHLVLLHGSCDGGVGGAVAEGDLLADHEAGHARDRHVGRAGGNRDHRTVGEGLPQRRTVAGRRPDACDLAGLHAGAGVDVDRIADRHAGRAPDVDGGIARARGDRQPGVGEAEQVEAASRELRPGRDLHRREDGLLGRVLGQGPVGDVDVTGAGVVELDERVRRVGGEPALMRNSLILTGLTFRTFSAVVSDCFCRSSGSSTRRCRPGRR